MQTWFVTAVPKYLDLATYLKELSALSKLWFCPAFWVRCIHTVSSVLTSRPTSVLTSNRVGLFLCDIYVTIRYINIICTDQELMSSIRFQHFLISPFLMANFKAKIKSNGNTASPCFRPFWMGNAYNRFYLHKLYYGFLMIYHKMTIFRIITPCQVGVKTKRVYKERQYKQNKTVDYRLGMQVTKNDGDN
jgi:hypothetical protein